MRILSKISAVLLALLPSKLKIIILRSRGIEVGVGCYIGLSIIDGRSVSIGDYVHIGHFNLLWRLKRLSLATGAKIGDCNWISGGGDGTFSLGRNSSLRRFHFLEASGDIRIGNNSILAGRRITIFTHGLSPSEFEDVRGVEIGEWCYVGALSSFVPGANIAKGTFVGLGAVVTKACAEEFVLLGGNPAKVIRKLSVTDTYFKQAFLRHEHHPSTYLG